MRKRLGHIYKFAGSPALAGAGRITHVDTTRRTASAVISTPAPDRVRDSLNPLGCSLDEYQSNPVVFWEHGKVLTKPVGTSEDPSTGKLAVYKSQSEVRATCWFTDKFLEAEQIFELVAEGTVRATSVRFTPVTQPVVRKSDTYFDEWMLLEWSWVGIGCNPEAIAATVAKGKLAGRQIVPSIAKSLELYLPSKKIQVPGFKAMDYEEMENEEMESEMPEEGMTTEDAPAEEEEVPAKGYGAQLMEAAYKAVSELYGNMEQGMGPLENPAVKEAMTAIMENLGQIKLAMEGAYSENYKAKLGEVCASCGQEQDEEQMLKSFLALGATQKFELMGVADRLKSVSSSRNLTKFQRDNLRESARTLDRLFSKAKEQRTEKPKESPEVAKQLSEMFGEMKELLGTLKSAVPARK
jgi:hypothetical protein